MIGLLGEMKHLKKPKMKIKLYLSPSATALVTGVMLWKGQFFENQECADILNEHFVSIKLAIFHFTKYLDKTRCNSVCTIGLAR